MIHPAVERSRPRLVERDDTGPADAATSDSSARSIEAHCKGNLQREIDKLALMREAKRNRCDVAVGAIIPPRNRSLISNYRLGGEAANLEPGRSAIYFVEAPLAALIKIGVTQNLSKRLFDIAGMSPVPLRFLGACAGDVEFEASLHRRFALHRDHGEWFRDHAGLRETIADLLNQRPHFTLQGHQ